MEKLYRAKKAKFLGLKNLGLGGPPGSALEMPLVNPGQQLKKSLVRRQCSLAIGQRASVNGKSAVGEKHVYTSVFAVPTLKTVYL